MTVGDLRAFIQRRIEHADICITYTRLRNPYASIVDAWLDSDMYGYRCCYKSRSGAINWSYLSTYERVEAIRTMQQAIDRAKQREQAYHPFVGEV